MDYILCVCKLFVVTTNLHFGHYCECIHILLAKIRHVKKRLNGCQFDKGQNKPCRSGGQFTIKSSMKYKCLGDAWYSNRCDPSASRAQHCCQIRMYLGMPPRHQTAVTGWVGAESVGSWPDDCMAMQH